MKKTTNVQKRSNGGVAALLNEVRQLIAAARNAAASTVNTLQVVTNFEIGRRIVENEQKGEKRAEYGAEVLKELSARLTEEFGKGFSPVNLSLMRKFFLTWQDRIRIFQQAAEKSALPEKSRMASDQTDSLRISETSIRKSPFTLSWTHYVLLISIQDPYERNFYEIEATNQGWSVPELKRQKASALYERLALSRDKDGIRKLASKGQSCCQAAGCPPGAICPNSWALMRRPVTPRMTLNRPLSITRSVSCSNSARGSFSRRARSGSPSTRIISSWIWYSITGFSGVTSG